MERLSSPNKVAGVKQTKAALREGKAKVVYTACNADESIVGEIEAMCREMNVELVCNYTRKELAKACRIDVPCAAAALLI